MRLRRISTQTNLLSSKLIRCHSLIEVIIFNHTQLSHFMFRYETAVNGRIHARFSSTATSLVQERDDAMKKLILSAESKSLHVLILIVQTTFMNTVFCRFAQTRPRSVREGQSSECSLPRVHESNEHQPHRTSG